MEALTAVAVAGLRDRHDKDIDRAAVITTYACCPSQGAAR